MCSLFTANGWAKTITELDDSPESLVTLKANTPQAPQVSSGRRNTHVSLWKLWFVVFSFRVFRVRVFGVSGCLNAFTLAASALRYCLLWSLVVFIAVLILPNFVINVCRHNPGPHSRWNPTVTRLPNQYVYLHACNIESLRQLFFINSLST